MMDSNSTTAAELATPSNSAVVPTLDQVAPTRKLTRTPANGPSSSRLRKEQRILLEAEHQFAQYGFEGASLEGIGNGVGISRHNLLYYFSSKEALYRRVLDDVLTSWGQSLEDFGHESCSPQEAIRNYIRTKLRSSLERPNAAKVFTKEVMAGAPRFADVI